MAKGDISLGTLGSEILLSAFGRTLQIRKQESSRMKRTVNGTMKKDIMYVKHKITLTYKEITGDALDDFDTIYALTQPLSLIIDNGGTPDTYTVYMKPLNRKRLILQGDGLWTGAKVELDEE
jgi:hypothetical protein